MKRLLVFFVVSSVANVSMAFAGESLVASGARHVQRVAAAESTVAVSSVVPNGDASLTANVPAAKTVAPSFQGQGGTVSQSGMSKGKKALLYIAIGVGFAATAWTIDHHVLDVTPSSLGTRKD